MQNKKGNTPLFRAADYGHEAFVRLLLAYKALVNEPDVYGWTPLHVAAYRSHEEVVRLLLANGALVNQQNKLGFTPLHYARVWGSGNKEEVVNALLDYGALDLMPIGSPTCSY